MDRERWRVKTDSGGNGRQGDVSTINGHIGCVGKGDGFEVRRN